MFWLCKHFPECHLLPSLLLLPSKIITEPLSFLPIIDHFCGFLFFPLVEMLQWKIQNTNKHTNTHTVLEGDQDFCVIQDLVFSGGTVNHDTNHHPVSWRHYSPRKTRCHIPSVRAPVRQFSAWLEMVREATVAPLCTREGYCFFTLQRNEYQCSVKACSMACVVSHKIHTLKFNP